ncbi:glycosyltransferase [Zunongwangia sp. F363]|uniref:Glycosyltransferase n=1 Tax=Autumnicola tepida TaxID=3075595 RepID=A0ABU3C7N2_9FLAO|nr:glycosyltransferase [Zunongwangia sp. F363]MDT0642283.1 glycosyltransferase [Zunongwangia sp. F363]
MERILHIVGRMDRAGAETMIMNLYRAIDRKNFQFDFLYFTGEVCDYDHEIELLGGKIYRLPSEEFSNPLKKMLAVNQFLKKENHIKTIHCHMLLSSGFHLLAAYLAGVKKRIVHSHSTSNKNNRKAIYNLPYKKLSQVLINNLATQFIACGKEAGSFLFPYRKKFIVLPNAIDTALFNEIGKKKSSFLRDLLKIPRETLIIVQVGRFNHIKNHSFTLKLARFMKEQNKDFHFVFVGNGSLLKEFQDKSRKDGLKNNLSFLGLREDIPEILAGSDVMILPSLHEGFPVVLVESQSVGIPAIVSNTVSNEVDLGVGLITFRSLNSSLQQWCDDLFAVQKKSWMNEQKRLEIIKKSGFDIQSSSKKIEAIYSAE